MNTANNLKQKAALAALDFIDLNMVIGIGTGSTVNFFIEALAKVKGKIDGAVASSIATEHLLKQHNIQVLDLNSVGEIPLYIDGADEFNPYLSLIKGGGGALTREKIIAACAKNFICIVDQSKQVEVLGKFPLPLEVIPMARSFVARQIVKLGAEPVYREGFVTDNGHVILDIHHLDLSEPMKMEKLLNNITGVVSNGIFAMRGADKVLMATNSEVTEITSKAKFK